MEEERQGWRNGKKKGNGEMKAVKGNGCSRSRLMVDDVLYNGVSGDNFHIKRRLL